MNMDMYEIYKASTLMQLSNWNKRYGELALSSFIRHYTDNGILDLRNEKDFSISVCYYVFHKELVRELRMGKVRSNDKERDEFGRKYLEFLFDGEEENTSEWNRLTDYDVEIICEFRWHKSIENNKGLFYLTDAGTYFGCADLYSQIALTHFKRFLAYEWGVEKPICLRASDETQIEIRISKAENIDDMCIELLSGDDKWEVVEDFGISLEDAINQTIANIAYL